MINIVKSEIHRVRHTWIPWVHIILPIFYSVLFFGVAKITGMKNLANYDIIKDYLVILGGVFPIICGAITYKSIDMEADAGNFQVMLQAKSRVKAYTGKIISLIIGFLFSSFFAIIIFYVLFGNQSIIEYLVEFFLITIGALPIYMIHLWVSLKFGGGATISLGFVETLMALLAMTGLGDKIWYFIPCTWSSRLSATYILGKNVTNNLHLYGEFKKWVIFGIPIIIIILVISIIWFNRWDGKSSVD